MPSRAEILARPAAANAVADMVRKRHDADPEKFHRERLRGKHADCALCGQRARILAGALDDGDNDA